MYGSVNTNLKHLWKLPDLTPVYSSVPVTGTLNEVAADTFGDFYCGQVNNIAFFHEEPE